MIILRNLICLIGLFLMSPIILLSTILIILEDGFPPFFKQDRLGKDKEIISIYKIRTMKKNSPQDGTHNVNNSYHLLSGRLIRKIKLDEFPQLINVIQGDINLIGPRPGLIVQEELTTHRTKNNIYSIKPGITGLAQATGFDMSNPSNLAKVDQIYIQNRSIKLNILILMATFSSLPRNTLNKKFKLDEI